MSVYCVLCGNRNKSVSYHRFPKQEEFRKQWLAFCGIYEHVLSTATRLCSNHFREEDLIKRSKGAYIKPNAVPSIRKKKRERQSNSLINEVIYDNANKKNKITDHVNVDSNVSIKDTPVSVDSQSILPSIENAQWSNCRIPSKHVPEFCCVDRIPDLAISPKPVKSLEIAKDGFSTSLREKGTQWSNCRIPPKVLFEPRFVGDIRTPHLDTPRKAQRALEIAKQTIVKLKRKVKTLQQSRNRLVARMTTMKDSLSHLKWKYLLLERAVETLQE